MFSRSQTVWGYKTKPVQLAWSWIWKELEVSIFCKYSLNSTIWPHWGRGTVSVRCRKRELGRDTGVGENSKMPKTLLCLGTGITEGHRESHQWHFPSMMEMSPCLMRAMDFRAKVNMKGQGRCTNICSVVDINVWLMYVRAYLRVHVCSAT
jgi:hypothetical protein